jgi:phospholipid transport system substrate-binding protein
MKKVSTSIHLARFFGPAAALLCLFGIFGFAPVGDSAKAAQAGPAVSPFVINLIETVKQVKKHDPDKNRVLTEQERARNQELAGQINRMLDIDFISTYALLSYWEKLEDQDRKRFISVFTELMSKVAYPNAGKFLEDLQVTVRKEKVIGQKAMVYTSVVHRDEGRIDIDFKLQQASSSWEVVDVYLDGVSLARNLRTQCLKIIRDHSFQELIDRMKKKIEERDTAQLKEVTGRE